MNAALKLANIRPGYADLVCRCSGWPMASVRREPVRNRFTFPGFGSVRVTVWSVVIDDKVRGQGVSRADAIELAERILRNVLTPDNDL